MADAGIPKRETRKPASIHMRPSRRLESDTPEYRWVMETHGDPINSMQSISRGKRCGDRSIGLGLVCDVLGNVVDVRQ